MSKPKGIPLSHAMICANIQHWYESATFEENIEGCKWYYDAYEFCSDMSRQFNIDTDRAAAIVAVLSPGTNWLQNKKDALNVALKKEGYKATTYRANVEKAMRLLCGEPVDSVLGGKKVKAFWACIDRPQITREVCIDRHAVRLATGWDLDVCHKYLQRKDVYEKIAECYCVVADHYGLLPWQVQAVTWLAFKNSLKER